jgi:hypothetical protein
MTALVVAATLMRLTFTAPHDYPDTTRGVVAYFGQRSADGGRAWTPASLYADSSANSGAPVPRPPGTPDWFFVSISTDRTTLLKGGTLFWIRGRDAAGNVAPWSNRVAVAYYDTVCGFWRGEGALPVVRADLIGPEMRVRLAPGDTALAKFVHFEYVQAEDAERILEVEPKGIALRGRWYSSVGACWAAGKPRFQP